MAERIRPGDVLPGIPSGSWNEFVDTAEFAQGLANPTGVDGPVALADGSLPVTVKLHEKLPAYSVVAIERGSTEEPTGLELGRLPFLDTVAPDEDKPFAITRRHGEPDENVPATLLGQTWVQIDIQNAADETCGIIDGDTDKLESGKGSTPIIWKESGTGVKWAIVQLGVGGSKLSLDKGFAIVIFDIEAYINTIPTDTISDSEPPAGLIKFGEGVAWPLAPVSDSFLESGGDWRDWEAVTNSDPTTYEADDETIYLHNATGSILKKGAVVQWWRVGDYRFVDAEDCS